MRKRIIFHKDVWPCTRPPRPKKKEEIGSLKSGYILKSFPFLTLAFIILSCKANTPLEAKPANADSVLAYLKNNVNPLFQSYQIEKAEKVLDSLHSIVKQLESYRLTCAWLRFKSVQKEKQDQIDSARYFAEESLRLANAKDTTQKDILGANIQLANILTYEKKYLEALQYGNNAYYAAKKIDTLALPMTCLRLADIYFALNDLPMNRKYLFEGYFRSVKPVHKIEFANNIARYYDEIGAYDSAVIFFKAVEKDTTIKSPYFDAVKYENLGINLTRINRYKEGLHYQLKAAAINHQIDRMDALSYFNLAATYRDLQQYGNALHHLDSAMNLARSGNDIKLIKRIWRAKATVLALQNNHPAAYGAMDSAYTYFYVENDSSLTAQARELDTKYRVREKENKINILSLTNESNLNTRSLQRVIIISILAVFFLLSCLTFLLWRRRQTKMILREADLKQQLLRALIDPHFLYNTLGLFKNLLRNGAIEKAIGYLNSLVKLMRFNFETVQENFVLLKSEIENVESYLHLQTLYRHGLFDYQINRYEGFQDDEIYIPSMLLQPFLENAILHGFSQIDYKGKITITIEKRSLSLRCIIEDNGRGFQPASGKDKTRSTTINRERLDILEKQTGRPATLKIIDKKNTDQTGTRVEIEIPFRHTKGGKGTSNRIRNYFGFEKPKVNYN